MSAFLEALASQTFLQNALIGGILASVACGVMGAYVVVKRIGFLAGGIAHAVLGGMGMAYFFGVNPIGGGAADRLGQPALATERRHDYRGPVGDRHGHRRAVHLADPRL